MGDRASVAEPGQLALVLVESSTPDLNFQTVRTPNNPDLLVYARRVRASFGAADAYCQETNTPLVVMSTGIEDVIPGHPSYPLIEAPNTGLRVLRFLKRVEDQAKYLCGWGAEVTEHHQASKKDTSGTAKKLISILDLSLDDIISVRDLEASRQEYPSIPDDSRCGYAAHRVTFTNPHNGDQEVSEILVVGREEYAKGLSVIFRTLQRSDVRSYIAEHGNRAHVVDLLEAGFLD